VLAQPDLVNTALDVAFDRNGIAVVTVYRLP
jgi:hypothetical protein